MSKTRKAKLKKQIDDSITSDILSRMASETRLAVVQKLLEGAGYRLARIRGSHHVFVHPGRLPVSIPVHRGKVKAFYVRQIEKLVAGEGT